MFTITLNLSAGADTPMYEQLYRYFVEEIHSGRLKTGEKLPSKRSLCAHLNISQATVETAYGMLVSEGYLLSRPRSGYYVSDFAALGQGDAAPPAAEEPPETVPQRPYYDFSTSAVDTSLFPYSSWAKLNKEIVYASPELLQRGERQGDAVLRQALCAFLEEYRGVKCAPSQIVVGAGMEYLTGLLLQLFPRETVFGMEDPGYASIYHTLVNNDRTLRFIPLDDGGMSLAALRASDVDVAYLTPSHQFPMGITTSAGRRSQLLRWAAEEPGRYIIEDDYDSEFRYGSRPLPAMQSMDTAGRVIYIGTFSRSIAPSIRIAYLVLPPALLERYRAMFSHSLSTVSRYEQAVMARFLSEGFYTRYLRRVGNRYRARRAALTAALSAIDGVRILGSGGGLHFLLRNPRLSEEELLRRAAEKGIALHGLSGYCRQCQPLSSTVVMGYGGLRDERIPQAAALLKEAWT